MKEKMIYPFNASACLEVQLSNNEWYRVTSKEFRSYNSPRRISHSENDQPYITEQYEGPIYLYGTNILVKEPEKIGLIFLNDMDSRVVVKSKKYGRL